MVKFFKLISALLVTLACLFVGFLVLAGLAGMSRYVPDRRYPVRIEQNEQQETSPNEFFSEEKDQNIDS